MSRAMLCGTLLAWLLASGAAHADKVAPSQFAFGLELATSEPARVHALELPERVLAGLTDVQLGDLCVFAANGRQLPHGFVRESAAGSAVSELDVHTFFPLETVSHEQTGDVEVTVQRDPGGAITRAYSRRLTAASARVDGYLVDLGELAPAWSFEGLSLSLRTERAFTVRAIVESSDDLTRFRALASGSLMNLERDGASLRRERVEFPPTRAPYLRVTLVDAPEGATLERLRVRVRPLTRPSPRKWRTVRGEELEAESGQLFAFALRGAFRPDRYDVALPETTALIEAALESGPSAEGPFRELDRALFRHGTANERALPRTSDRFFRLRVAPQGGGVHGGQPALRLGYVPPRLVYAGDDGGPHLLAYGSGGARCEQFDEAALRTLAGGALPPRDTVRVSGTRTLGGEAALARPAPRRSTRVYVLWSVLIAAVAALSLVARALLKKV